MPAGLPDIQKTCLVICGPTAVGKTALAIELATGFHTSILSFDSRQCYRELNIGVAKPTADELETVQHYFINTLSITDDFSAADYANYASAVAEQIFSSQDILVVVGGTGMYLDAFEKGMDAIPPINRELREHLRAQYHLKGFDWLKLELEKEDPDFLQMQNPQRMLRALEVKLSTGKRISEYHQALGKKSSYRFVKIGLDLPREQLYQRINSRVDVMMQDGLLEEADQLRAFQQLNSLNTVGYKELFSFLANEITLSNAVEQIKQNTRRYAKRQLTWFRRDNSVKWFEPTQTEHIKRFCTMELFK